MGSRLRPSARGRAYWERATSRLESEHLELYEKLQLAVLQDGQKNESLDSRIRHVIAEDVQRITDRQWAIKWRSRRVKLRPFIDKTVKAFDTLKDVGSAAASLDPHAALAWAGICMLVPLVLNMSSQEQAAKTGLDEIAAKMAEWMIVERVHDDAQKDPSHGGFDEGIISLYAAILEYEAVALCFFQRGTVSRWGRSITKTDDFKGILEEIDNREFKLRNLFSAMDKSTTQGTLREIYNQTQKIVQDMEEAKLSPSVVLRWLSPLQYGFDHDAILQELRSEYMTTGRWLFESDEYNAWNVSDHYQKRVLCLRGHVGTGKTSLACILIEQQLRQLESSRETRLAYFYCSKKQYPSLTALDVLRNLLSQLSWMNEGTSLAGSIQSLHKQADHSSGRGKPNVKTCVELLITMLAQTKRATIIVDALDECEEPDELLESLSAVHSEAVCCLRIFLTGRMHVRPTVSFPDCLNVYPTRNQHDIVNFIRKEVAVRRTKLLRDRKDLEDRLIKLLAARAENV